MGNTGTSSATLSTSTWWSSLSDLRQDVRRILSGDQRGRRFFFVRGAYEELPRLGWNRESTLLVDSATRWPRVAGLLDSTVSDADDRFSMALRAVRPSAAFAFMAEREVFLAQEECLRCKT